MSERAGAVFEATGWRSSCIPVFLSLAFFITFGIFIIFKIRLFTLTICFTLVHSFESTADLWKGIVLHYVLDALCITKIQFLGFVGL